MKDALLIFIGGGIGSILRWALSLFILTKSAFPAATFSANFLACILLGGALVYTSSEAAPVWFRPLFVIGLCGGFSTFSTFSAENVALLKGGNYSMFAFYTTASIVLCISGILLGHFIISFLQR